MKKLLLMLLAAAMLSTILVAADPNVGGSWEMTMDSPHGKMTGPLTLQQDGTKLTGNGKVDGEKVTLTMDTPGGKMTITFEGTLDGDKLSGTTKPINGEWSAVRK